MPELPEVEALVQDLRGRLVGRAISRVDLAAFSALKTFDPPLHALHGTLVDDVTRHGKFLDIDASGVHLVIHLARAGWIRWRDEVPALPARPNSKNPLAARVVIDDPDLETQPGLDITEAGTRKGLAIYVVRDPQEVEGIARLGPDPLSDDFTIEVLREILAAEGRKQIKGVLRMQSIIAGIGNAYSDEILHAARMSPFKPANSLEEDDLQTLYDAIRDDAGRRGRALERAGGQRAQGREEEQPRRPRPHRAGLPGLRRRGARGVVRRLEPAVLPDLPDRREAARRPADVAAAEVDRPSSSTGAGRAHPRAVRPTPRCVKDNLTAADRLTQWRACRPTSCENLSQAACRETPRRAPDLGPGDVARAQQVDPLVRERDGSARPRRGSAAARPAARCRSSAPTGTAPRAAAMLLLVVDDAVEVVDAGRRRSARRDRR